MLSVSPSWCLHAWFSKPWLISLVLDKKADGRLEACPREPCGSNSLTGGSFGKMRNTWESLSVGLKEPRSPLSVQRGDAGRAGAAGAGGPPSSPSRGRGLGARAVSCVPVSLSWHKMLPSSHLFCSLLKYPPDPQLLLCFISSFLWFRFRCDISLGFFWDCWRYFAPF